MTIDTETEPTVSRNPDVLLIGSLIWSGHCLFPATGPGDPEQARRESHARCHGSQYTRATGKTHICPCAHHLVGDEYDCGGCGYLIREAPALGLDEDFEPQYVHVDEAGTIFSIECP